MKTVGLFLSLALSISAHATNWASFLTCKDGADSVVMSIGVEYTIVRMKVDRVTADGWIEEIYPPTAFNSSMSSETSDRGFTTSYFLIEDPREFTILDQTTNNPDNKAEIWFYDESRPNLLLDNCVSASE